MATWTSEQILALAPDEASVKSGRGLSSRAKWQSIGQWDVAIWGECQGSGKDPYRSQIDLSEPAFKCSCPSRKFPCKHGLGLFLVYASDPSAFPTGSPPAWVSDWMASRVQRDTQRQQKQSQTQAAASDPVAQAKRAEKRLQKVAAGVEELSRWLQDRIRQGLATLPTESYGLWDQAAARLIDAQAPGLARQVKALGSLAHGGSGWTDPLLASMGRLYLLLEGFGRIDSLPLPVQIDIRTQIGWSLSQEEVLADPAALRVSDYWQVVGQSVEPEERLRVQRTWLWGRQSQRPGLVLQFAHGAQPFDQVLLPGSELEAELVFYPSAYPLRAVIKSHRDPQHYSSLSAGSITMAMGLEAYSQALASNPWLERFPLVLQQVIPTRFAGSWVVVDPQGQGLALTSRFEQGWLLVALSGGDPISLVGEWDGTRLLPLSCVAQGEFYPL